MNADRTKLVEEIREALAKASTEEEVLKTAVEHLHAFSDGFNWTGIYLLRGEILEIGPYLGPPTPHTRIPLNQGICGAAASSKKTIVVDDVNADPRFLACSLSTRSELVVPLMDGDTCVGEIDIDSDEYRFFSPDDREMVEAVAAIVVQRLKEVRA